MCVTEIQINLCQNKRKGKCSFGDCVFDCSQKVKRPPPRRLLMRNLSLYIGHFMVAIHKFGAKCYLNNHLINYYVLTEGYRSTRKCNLNCNTNMPYLAELPTIEFAIAVYVGCICLTSLTRAKPKEKNEICCSISTRAVKCDGVFFVLQHGFQYGFQHA